MCFLTVATAPCSESKVAQNGLHLRVANRSDIWTTSFGKEEPPAPNWRILDPCLLGNTFFAISAQGNHLPLACEFKFLTVRPSQLQRKEKGSSCFLTMIERTLE